MKPDFEAKYRTMMKNMIDKGESFDSIKSYLFVLRDDLLNNAARKLRARVDGDVAYVFSTTVCNSIAPLSGLLITPAYTLSICEDISSAMGIAVSGTTAAKDTTAAIAQTAFLEIITKEGFKIIGQEVATTLMIPFPGAAMLMMPYKWFWHREHKFHMIHFTHQKAEKYHADWIVGEMNRFAIRDKNGYGGGGNVGGGDRCVRVHIPPGRKSGELLLVRLPNGKEVVEIIPCQSKWMYDGSRPFFRFTCNI